MKRTKEQAAAELERCLKELAEAKERDAHLRERLLEVKRAQSQAEAEVGNKRKAASHAQAEVDSFEPRATIVYSRDSRLAAVIVKRTPHTITVRRFGQVESPRVEFRKDKETGVWTQWPAPKGSRYYSLKPLTLEVVEP